jgi:tripartite-type tricarboxylate transporter receptor subunit TctC
MLPGLYPKLSWSPDTDLKPITMTAQTPVVIAVSPNTKFKTLKELIAFAKANPGKLNYGSGGAGSATHLSAEFFKSVAGVDIAHIPFKGAGEATTGLLSGTVELVIASPPTVIGHIKRGNVTALAVSSPSRSAALPDVPSIVEAGLPGYNVYFWFGLMAPKGVPDSVVDFLQKAVAKILALPEVKELLARQITEPVGSTPVETAKQLSAETKRWREVIKSAGITLD